jgi:hypothetical protein
MPEVRGATGPALADLSGGGFFIRRVTSPGAVVVKGGVKPLARYTLTPSRNKENVPPPGAMRGAPKRRSPLPDWYPRTPLRDITAIVKVVNYYTSNILLVLQMLWAFLLIQNRIWLIKCTLWCECETIQCCSVLIILYSGFAEVMEWS